MNTTDSRVELVFDLTSTGVLTPQQLEQATARLRGQLIDGTLVVVASEHRSQHRNRVIARERLVTLIRDALAPPPPRRRPTRPSRGAKERRLKAKKQRGQTKSLRSRPDRSS